MPTSNPTMHKVLRVVQEVPGKVQRARAMTAVEKDSALGL